MSSVIQIFKKRSRSELKNYRPISLTSIVCTMFEAMNMDSIEDNAWNTGIMRENQLGFIKGCCYPANILQGE